MKKLFFIILSGLLFSECSIGVFFNPVINGIEYTSDAEIEIDSVKFLFDQLMILNYHHSPQLSIKVLNNSSDTVFYNPSKIKLYKNKMQLCSSSGKDSVFFIQPLAERTIYISNEIDVIDEYYDYEKQNFASKTIILELISEGFKRNYKDIPLPNIRYVPEDREDFADLIFPLK